MTESAAIHAAGEQDLTGLNDRLNWLRASVLGANDGIVSVAGMVMGVAGATTDRGSILVAGVAGLVAGAISMGAGEYVSVSTQSDAEKALLAKEKRELEEMPDEELDELTDIITSRGIERTLARKVALQLSQRNALRAHAVLELGIDPDDTVHPWHAAIASTISFTVGAILPLLTIMLPSVARIEVTVVAVAVALAITGAVSAKLGYASPRRALIRNVLGGLVAMAVTYGIGAALGTQIS